MIDIIQKTKEDYNHIARHFADTRYDVWPEMEQFKKYIKNGQNILDWGCGSGRLALMLKDKKVKYFGVDISSGLLKIARQKHKEHIKNGQAKFYSVAHKEKKFVDNFFDLVFMVASFHHLPDENSRLTLLKKTYAELKKGGKLIILVWNLQSDWAKQKKYFKKISENDFLIPWKNQQGETEVERYYHHFSKEELKKLLVNAGFKIVKMDFYGPTNWTDNKKGRNLIAIAKK